MCGIFGVVSKNNNCFDELKKMHFRLIHRGPDNFGYYLDEENNFAIGHNRLSILDLTDNSNQPYENDDFVITYNGEIYNYLELKADLQKEYNITFSTDGDFEVLYKMWTIFGIKTLEYLDGMFAISVYDKKQNKVILIRDRFGEKPLFYNFSNFEFQYASEIKAFTFAKEPEIETLNFFLNQSVYYNENNPSKTFFKGINSVQPSHYIIYDLKSNSISDYCYYKLSHDKIEIDFQDAKDELGSILSKVVGRRLRSHVQNVTLLSGGLDSNLIIAIQNGLGVKPDSISAVFPSFEHDESNEINYSLNYHDLRNTLHVPISKSDFQLNINEVIKSQDEPFGSTSILAQFMIFKRLKESGYKVALDGQGSDEIFAGYHYYFDRYFHELSYSSWRKLKLKIDEYKQCRLDNRFDFYLSKKSRLSSTLKKMTKKDFASLDNLLDDNLFRGELQEMLRYGDRNSMHHSIELRSPYLSHEMVEFVFKLPNEFRLNLGYTKYILRSIASESTFGNAKDIIWSKDKKGFVTPFSEFTSDLKISNRVIDFLFDYKLDAKLITPWKAFMIQNYFCD